MVKEGAAAQNFTDRTDDSKGDGKTDTHAQTVEDGIAHRIFAGESLCSTQHNTVDHNQRDKDTQAGKTKALRIANSADESL